ncbi:MAG: class I SAM-dependent methyltransferase [Nitrospirae bacterium]|nr:class I SAM-dependent methyltransferase [Nitrospirota bacterium]
MNKPPLDLDFTITSLLLWIRDLFLPRKNILREVGIKPGFKVLDYGCGPGGYIIPTAELVGDTGKIYALDVHPLAVRKVKKIAGKQNLSNVETILSDCKTGFPDESIDIVLLYDTFHLLSDPAGVLEEIHRVLKPAGVLSFSDHHMKEDEILSRVTKKGLFKLSQKGRKTYGFSKV